MKETAYECTNAFWEEMDKEAWDHLNNRDLGWIDEDGKLMAPSFHSCLEPCGYLMEELKNMTTPPEYRGPKLRINSNKYGYSCTTFYGTVSAETLPKAVLAAFIRYKGKYRP
jgi:hypothetical protein